MHIDFTGASHLIDRCWRDLRVATAFLTRLPVQPPLLPANDDTVAGEQADKPADYLAGATAMFPVVGFVIGAVGALVLAITHAIGLHPIASALLAVAAMAILTGGLHEDGLADFVDGLGGGTRVEERLNIMRDSRIGAFGTLALIIDVELRATFISQLASLQLAVAAVIVAALASRAVIPAVMRWTPPARSDGFAFDAGRPQPTELTIALALTLVALFLTFSIVGAVAALLAGAAGAAVVALIARKRLGGHTGDVLGAAQQVSEILILAAIAAAE